jgi:uncharacterized membrane protein
MTSRTSTRTRRGGHAAIVAAVVLAALVAVAWASPGTAAGPTFSMKALSAAKPGPSLGPRVLPELELRPQAARTRRAPAGSSDGGLLLDRGVFRPLPDVPGALQTVHFRNNNRGQIAGAYVVDSDGTPRIRGFLMQKGHVTRIDVPGAMGTLPLGINDRGQVVGGWVAPDATVNPVTGESGPVHGFLWERGRFKKFDIPGAITTAPYEINNRGQIVGNYTDADGAQHGFVLRRGVVTTIDHSSATDAPDMTGTRVVGIDDRGRLVGSYGDDAGTIRAWKWEDGDFTTIHPPGALLSEASEINNRGRIVARYLDATPKLRSFLLDRGRLTRIDAPDRCDTAALGLNDRGQILIAAAGTTDGSTCPPQGG